MACNFKPYEGTEKYIFVSYAHADGGVVYPIIERLHEAGFRIWYDEGIEWGTEWPEAIARHLAKCEVCLAFHSRASAVSANCRQEINYAQKKGRGILSVYLEDVELSEGMDMQMTLYQSTFWYQYKDKNQFFDRLINNTPILAPCKSGSTNTEYHEDTATSFNKELSPQDIIDYRARADECMLNGLHYYTKGVMKIFRIGRKRFYRKAGKLYKEGVEIFEQLAPQTNLVYDYKELAEGYSSLSYVYRHMNKLSEAINSGKKCIETTELLYESGLYVSCDVLASRYSDLGDLFKEDKKVYEAAEWYKKSAEKYEQAVSEDGIVKWGRDLSDCYQNLGDVCKDQKNFTEARAWYEKSVNVAERLVKEEDSSLNNSALSLAYGKLALIDSSSDIDEEMLNKSLYFGRRALEKDE